MRHSTPQDIQEEVICITDPTIDRFRSAEVPFVSQAQEPKDAIGDWSPKGRYKILFPLRNRSGQFRGAPSPCRLSSRSPEAAPRCPQTPRPRHKLHCVDKHRLRGKKIAKLVRRSSLGLVDMKPIRPINVPLTAWGTKGLMLPGSNWAGV